MKSFDIQTLPIILGQKFTDDADYLEICRKKRNETEYDFAGNISDDESQKLNLDLF